MRRFLSAFPLAGALLALSIGGASAAMTMATVQLRPPANIHMMALARAAGTARISYAKHDADIRLTADNLPQLATLHANAYVLWLVGGTHKVNAGSLKVDGDMAALHTTTMDATFNRLVVTAERSARVMRPMGTRVLVGAVMRH
jgi:hypothetical protein